MEFDSIITAVSSGKADVGYCRYDRYTGTSENIDFSDSYTNFTAGLLLCAITMPYPAVQVFLKNLKQTS